MSGSGDGGGAQGTPKVNTSDFIGFSVDTQGSPGNHHFSPGNYSSPQGHQNPPFFQNNRGKRFNNFNHNNRNSFNNYNNYNNQYNNSPNRSFNRSYNSNHNRSYNSSFNQSQNRSFNNFGHVSIKNYKWSIITYIIVEDIIILSVTTFSKRNFIFHTNLNQNLIVTCFSHKIYAYINVFFCSLKQNRTTTTHSTSIYSCIHHLWRIHGQNWNKNLFSKSHQMLQLKINNG